MFTRVYNIVNKRARALLPLLICAGLFCYFSLHFAGGKHGLEARDQLHLRVSSLKKRLDTITKDRKFYDHRIKLMSSGHVHRDLADELARKSLQYAAPDELVIFD